MRENKKLWKYEPKIEKNWRFWTTMQISNLLQRSKRVENFENDIDFEKNVFLFIKPSNSGH